MKNFVFVCLFVFYVFLSVRLILRVFVCLFVNASCINWTQEIPNMTPSVYMWEKAEQ